ncbi:putative ion transport protein [Methanocella paludicola SANAE]|uniref:Ion transport protein n=1 Tax=Methanocella paludicola (strain DSM 17711 / JCM 13418 / NBRC 101707 / SANAE) TaxID=304371 RepID=D1YYI6_METPS|nr:ion transporter [Methanocella paludicola]BAI61508.1 putative ion transport protein [Methanocella paludicola SANAE]
MRPGLKARVYDILNIKDPDDPATVLANYFLVTLIVLNIVVFFLMTFERIFTLHPSFFTAFEVFSVGVFTIEYILRVWSCDLDPEYRQPLRGRLKYMSTNVLAIADLLAILPFYLPFIGTFDLIFLRALRLFRLFRVFKLARYSDSMDIIERVLRRQKEYILLTFAIQFVLLLISAGIMYYLEHDAQPQKFATIFDAMWWGLIPMTGVGYGDVFPVTPEGKAVGGLLTFIGVVVSALPIGVIAAGLEIELNKEAREMGKNKIKKAVMYAGKKRNL